jgi:transposase
VCGYVWGKTNKKTPVKIVNEKERQTFYGAFNYHTHEVVINKYDSADSVNTTKYIEHLRLLSGFNNILIIWDGASYHRFAEMPKYLSRINEGLSEDNWRVRCVLLAPHAPEENPMEDIWLKGKNWLRKNFILNKTFNNVIKCFASYFEVNTFNFPKMSIFGVV